MTIFQLLSYLLLVLFIQVTLAAMAALWRHLYTYSHLNKRMDGLAEEVMDEPGLKELLPNGSTAHVDPWTGFRDFKVVRRIFEDVDENVCSFYLQPTDNLPLPTYKPGQFLTFDVDIGKNKSVTRCYSLSDRPDQSYYRVSIKRVPPPRDRPDLPAGISSNHFHDNIQEGHVVRAQAPSGHFFLEPDTTPVVLIAGGIGITPLLSMLNTSLKSGSQRHIFLFYGATNSSDHAMKGYFEELALKHHNFHLQVSYTHPLPTDKPDVDFQNRGFVDLHLLRNTLPYQIYDYFVCGPRPMMETLIPALEDWGVPEQHIFYEAFGPASITRAKKAPVPDVNADPITVTFSKSNKTITWDGESETLLDFAESNGIEVASGCRAGGCGCCQTKITSGEVDYTHVPDFDVEPGSCLMCVSRPTQDLTIEA